MATHSSVLAWRIPWTEEPGGLQSMGVTKSQLALKYGESRVRHAQNLRGTECICICCYLWTKNTDSPALPKTASSAGLSPQVASSESPP